MPEETIQLEPVTERPFPARMLLATVISIAVAGGVGYYAWNLRGDYTRARAELDIARRDKGLLGRERQRAEALGAELAACKTERDATAERCATTAESLDVTRAELETLRKQRADAARRLEAFKELTGKFQKMIDAGKLDVVVRDGRMIVKLPAEVLFDSGKAELSRAGELALMEVAIVLRQLPDRKFMVAGHTDNRPLEGAASRYRNNWELSTARAVTVTEFLIEARLSPGNLVAAGYGEHDPVASNGTPKEREKNRRIEIVLLPTIDELPTFPEPAAAAQPATP